MNQGRMSDNNLWEIYCNQFLFQIKGKKKKFPRTGWAANRIQSAAN